MKLAICSKQEPQLARKWMSYRRTDHWPIISRWIDDIHPTADTLQLRARQVRDSEDYEQATHLLVYLDAISCRLHNATFAAGAMQRKPIAITAFNIPLEVAASILGNWVYLPNVIFRPTLEESYARLKASA